MFLLSINHMICSLYSMVTLKISQGHQILISLRIIVSQRYNI